MNFIFCYLLAGWESLAYNDKILENTLFNPNFKILNKKYNLANTKYHNTNYFLYSYYSICHHLKIQGVKKNKLVNKEELFNFCHSSLYNI